MQHMGLKMPLKKTFTPPHFPKFWVAKCSHPKLKMGGDFTPPKWGAKWPPPENGGYGLTGHVLKCDCVCIPLRNIGAHLQDIAEVETLADLLASASTMIVAHVHDEALFHVKSYTDHTYIHFSLPGVEYTQALARGKSSQIQNNMVIAYLNSLSSASGSAQ